MEEKDSKRNELVKNLNFFLNIKILLQNYKVAENLGGGLQLLWQCFRACVQRSDLLQASRALPRFCWLIGRDKSAYTIKTPPAESAKNGLVTDVLICIILL